MTGSLRTLLRDIVDYAGLFPPAGLAMPPAAENYARYRAGEHTWMLGPFICPAARLMELSPLIGPRTPEDPDPWRLSVLGAPAENADAFLPGLVRDLDRVAGFAHRSPGYAIPEVFEVRFPPSVLSAGRPDAVRRVLAGAAEAFAALDREGPPVAAGLKIRTGGVTASAFPAPEEVAGFIAAARDAGVRMKATAGLHHPLRRFAPEVETTMHGFLNVFVGAVLAHAERLGPGEIVPILEDEDPTSYCFDDEGLSWRDRHVSTAGIAAARRELAVSFGSCSFDEPVEDLQDLGLL